MKDIMPVQNGIKLMLQLVMYSSSTKFIEIH
jgi:hypothetical protein